MLGRRHAATLLLLGGLGLVGCGDEITVVAPTPAPPTTPTAPKPDRIEFRVLGTHRNVLVRHASSQDGTTQTTTDLPYVSTFTTIEPLMFLSLEATTQSTFIGSQPFLSVQILVNGSVLREASSNLFSTSLSISITYRRATATTAAAILAGRTEVTE